MILSRFNNSVGLNRHLGVHTALCATTGGTWSHDSHIIKGFVMTLEYRSLCMSSQGGSLTAVRPGVLGRNSIVDSSSDGDTIYTGPGLHWPHTTNSHLFNGFLLTEYFYCRRLDKQEETATSETNPGFHHYCRPNQERRKFVKFCQSLLTDDVKSCKLLICEF